MTASPTGVLAQLVSASQRQRMQDDGHDQHPFTRNFLVANGYQSRCDHLRCQRAAPCSARRQPALSTVRAIFTRLLRDAGVRANGVPDAYLVALAVENGATWACGDGGFARFAGLKLLGRESRHPWMNLAFAQGTSGPVRLVRLSSQSSVRLSCLGVQSPLFSCALERYAGPREHPVTGSGGQ